MGFRLFGFPVIPAIKVTGSQAFARERLLLLNTSALPDHATSSDRFLIVQFYLLGNSFFQYLYLWHNLTSIVSCNAGLHIFVHIVVGNRVFEPPSEVECVVLQSELDIS